jgi:hypothetical protein
MSWIIRVFFPMLVFWLWGTLLICGMYGCGIGDESHARQDAYPEQKYLSSSTDANSCGPQPSTTVSSSMGFKVKLPYYHNAPPASTNWIICSQMHRRQFENGTDP